MAWLDRLEGKDGTGATTQPGEEQAPDKPKGQTDQATLDEIAGLKAEITGLQNTVEQLNMAMAQTQS